MALLKWLIGAAAAFGGLVALMYVAQRSLMYFLERLQTSPAVAGLPYGINFNSLLALRTLQLLENWSFITT